MGWLPVCDSIGGVTWNTLSEPKTIAWHQPIWGWFIADVCLQISSLHANMIRLLLLSRSRQLSGIVFKQKSDCVDSTLQTNSYKFRYFCILCPEIFSNKSTKMWQLPQSCLHQRRVPQSCPRGGSCNKGVMIVYAKATDFDWPRQQTNTARRKTLTDRGNRQTLQGENLPPWWSCRRPHQCSVDQLANCSPILSDSKRNNCYFSICKQLALLHWYCPYRSTIMYI
jgi:hypothetical protein